MLQSLFAPNLNAALPIEKGSTL